MDDERRIDLLEERTGYHFRRRELALRALTHPSLRHERRQLAHDNQRLEFLGDAVLGLVAAERLFRLENALAEGELTRRREAVVQSATLGRVAHKLGLHELLLLGRGAELGGVRSNDSAAGDAVEALVGALYLDGGLAAAQMFVEQVLGEDLDRQTSLREENPKGYLQERMQGAGRGTPVYRLLSRTGPAHAPHFVVSVDVGEQELARGEGPSKRSAERAAAQTALAAQKDLTTASAGR